MGSNYTGLFVQRSPDGTIHSVQVVDIGGNSIPLPPNIYIERGIRPLIEKLPDEKDYKASSS
jgi:hypothetical protein